MIVPGSRLLFWAALTVVPFAMVITLIPATAWLACLLLAGFVVLVVADALIAARPLAGVSLALAPVIRLTKDRAGKFELRIQNPAGHPVKIRLGLAFPPELNAAPDYLDVALPGGSEWSQAVWACRPDRRGRFPLTEVYLEAGSPLGFWDYRRCQPLQSEVRVYPNLLTDRKHLAAVFLNRGAFGSHARRQVGRGREFEKLREYVPGDGFDEIHWKATARRSRPITKVFQVERTQEVYVIVDTSRLSARKVAGAAGEPTPVLERFLTSALLLGLAAEQQGDLFGLVTFANQVDHFVRARNGQAHYGSCRDAIYALQPQIVSPDFHEVCSFIRLRLRRRAMLFILTALDDPALAESFTQSLELIRQQHLVSVNVIQPADMRPMFDGGPVASDDEIYSRLAGHLRWQAMRELQKNLQRRGVRLSLLENDMMAVNLVSQYLTIKQRQLL